MDGLDEPTLPMVEPDPDRANEPQEVRLRDLRPTDRPTIIIARVVTAERREVTRRSDGGRRPVVSGLLSDGTATIRFTWWDPPEETIERGTVLRAGPVQVREFRGRAEVSFGWKTRVAPASEAEMPEVRVDDMPAPTITAIRGGDEGFRLEARVARVTAKTVSVREERRLLHEGVLLDATGEIGFTAWSDFRLQAGEGIRIIGASAKSFRGRPQVVLHEGTRVERRESSELPSLQSWSSPPPRPIAEVQLTSGAERATLEGVLLAVLPPSGLVDRCPRCPRTVTDGLCREHGAVVGVPDLRARFVLDDGSGCVTVHTDRAITERWSGTTLEECLSAGRARPPLREEDLLDSLFGQRFRVTGRATHDTFGLTLYAETMDPASTEIKLDLGKWRAILGGGE